MKILLRKSQGLRRKKEEKGKENLRKKYWKRVKRRGEGGMKETVTVGNVKMDCSYLSKDKYIG